MKKLLCTLLSLTTALSLAACADKAPTPQDSTNGGPSSKEDTVTIYAITEQRLYDENDQLMSKILYEYDHRGLPILCQHDSTIYQEYFDEELGVYLHEALPCDGIIDRKFTATYDDHGNLASYAICRELDENGQLTMSPGRTYTYEYNDQGQLTHWVGTTADDLKINGSFYLYDDQGRLTTLQGEQRDGTRKDSLQVTYTEAGQIHTIFSDDMEVDRLQTHTYDDQGRIIRIDLAYVFDGEPSLQCYFQYTYDDHGSITARTCYEADGTLSRQRTYAHTYDGDTLVETRYDQKTVTYDRDGNITQVTDEDGTYIQYSYTAIQVAPEDADLSIARLYYKQEEDFESTILKVRFWQLPRIMSVLTPSLFDYWF